MKMMTILLSLLFSASVFAAAKVGQKAPKFAEVDHTGKMTKLEDFKGKWVVLEWFNEGCPYVEKHYDSNNMQALQKKFGAKEVAWLSVASSAEGKQGYVAPDDAKAQVKRAKMMSKSLLLDADGTMGRAYGAKTTPHMFVINPEGTVVYAGAIDSNSSANPKTIKGAENYVTSALTSGLAGQPIKTASTKPYGCSVKYN